MLLAFYLPGSVLASQDPAVPVLSALEGLTVVFGMGTGVSPPPWPPDFIGVRSTSHLCVIFPLSISHVPNSYAPSLVWSIP